MKKNNVIPFMNKRSPQKKWFKKKVKSKRQRRHDMFMCVVVGAMLLIGIVFIGQGITAKYEQQSVQEHVKVKTDVLAGEKKAVAALENQANLLKDEEYVAKLARSRYYLSQDGEIIFSLPEDNDSKQAQLLNRALLKQQEENKTSQGG